MNGYTGERRRTRAGSGNALDGHNLRVLGIIPADNLTPQKARILLALALTFSRELAEIRRIFATYSFFFS